MFPVETSTIALGPIALNETDPSGVTWVFDAIDGWHSGPGVEVQQVQRAGHGQFAQRGRRTGRQITVTGHCYADSRGPVEAASRKLAAVLADGGFESFVFSDTDGPTLWADVQLFEQPRISWSGREWFAYQLSLLAPDPYRYGTTSTDSTGFASDPVGAGLVFPLFDPDGMLDFGVVPTSLGTVTVRNDGTADTAPVFSIAGPSPVGGFSIVESTGNGRITSSSVIPAGSTLAIDARDGSAVLDGVAERTGDLIVDQWPTVPAGGEATFLFTPELSPSAAVLTAEVTSAYW